MNKLLPITRNLLLAFVFISIGYALGKNSLKPSSNTATAGNTGITVYYLHTTFRCSTCNRIEKQTIELLNREYAPELRDGKITIAKVNFQENETLAKKFGVLASCVVVAKTEDGKITSFERLDKVWDLLDKPDEFNRYINAAIKKILGREEKS